MTPETVIGECECWRCNRCGYVWPTRGRHAPTRCARCASRYWATERVRKRRSVEVPIGNQIPNEAGSGPV